MKELIFVSSVQKELAAERNAIRDFVHGNRLLGKHFDVFLFEDLPAKSRRPDEVYLDQVQACSIFLSLFAVEYGWEDPKDGLSPTEREFNRATELNRHRLLFLKNTAGTKPHPKMAALIDRAKSELVYKRFASAADLTSLLYDSLIEYLEQRGTIQDKPFDAASCRGATLDDIADARIKWFLPIARRERNLNLAASATKHELLTHLKLADGDGVTNAAVLLFGTDPQKSALSAVVKCAHYHGTEVAKPIPSHQVFEGTLFDQVDNAVDFVLSKLDRSVGTRAVSARAPVKYEMPKEAIADRIEVWNPGSLPRGLRPEDLEKPHSSEPYNPLIARPLYLARYIENIGTGTLDVIGHCRDAGLPMPEFEQRGGQFVVTLWRDWLTADVLAGMDLNDRQLEAIPFLRTQRAITNAEYQRITGAPRRTATHDLKAMVAKGLLVMTGEKRGAHYSLAKYSSGNAPNLRQMRHPVESGTAAGSSEGYAPDMRNMSHDAQTRKEPDKRASNASIAQAVKVAFQPPVETDNSRASNASIAQAVKGAIKGPNGPSVARRAGHNGKKAPKKGKKK